MEEHSFPHFESEADAAIEFETIELPSPPLDYDLLRKWIEQILLQYGARLHHLQYVFCTDAYLHRINVEFLQHDTLTDIITFPYSSFPNIHADLFISLERVQENAGETGHAFEEELHRVMIHGVLHLCGLGDKTREEAAAMRKAEDDALELLANNRAD